MYKLMSYVAFLSAIVSFLVVLLLTPWFISYIKKCGLQVKDMNKKNTPLVPLSGGLVVLAGIIIGSFLFILIRIFWNNSGGLFLNDRNLALLLASLASVIIITVIGFLDDLIIRGNKETSSGLNQWQKPLLTLFAAVPLMAVNAGMSTLTLPFIGTFDFGILYPLVLIPIGVVGASNMVNLFAGFNGLEAGMGIIYITSLGLYAYVNHSFVACLIALVTVASLLAFLYYNWYPAKILPGDSLTYLIGAVVAVIAIVGNLEKAALIISIPFIIEFFLKLRGKFKIKSYGYCKNGKIQSYYTKIYSIPHIFTRTGRFTEKQVVYFCMFISLIFSLLIWVI